MIVVQVIALFFSVAYLPALMTTVLRSDTKPKSSWTNMAWAAAVTTLIMPWGM